MYRCMYTYVHTHSSLGIVVVSEPRKLLHSSQDAQHYHTRRPHVHRAVRARAEATARVGASEGARKGQARQRKRRERSREKIGICKLRKAP